MLFWWTSNEPYYYQQTTTISLDFGSGVHDVVDNTQYDILYDEWVVQILQNVL